MKNKEFSILNFQLSITEIRAHLCHQWGMFFSPTDSTDFHGFVFLVAANALGIGAASFWSVSGKRYSGKPDGDSRNALLFKV